MISYFLNCFEQINYLNSKIKVCLDSSSDLIKLANTAFYIIQNSNQNDDNIHSFNHFKSKKRFKRLKHKGDEGKYMFDCLVTGCSKKYTTKENLNLHISNVHLQVKPYKCSFCKKIFSHRNGKIYHERKKHLKISPFRCEKCNMNFVNKSTLTYHITKKHLI